MRLHLFTPVLLLALTACASAPGRHGTPRLGAEVDAPDSTTTNHLDEFAMLDERLDLTDEQEASVRQALDALDAARLAARRQPDLRSRTSERERARVETDARILATLTVEQRATFNEIRRERETTYDPLVQRQLDLLTRRLTLTDEQRRAIAPILVRRIEQIEPLVSRAAADEAQEQARTIREETDHEILALLTDEQAAIYRDMMAEREGRGRRGGRRR